MIDAGKKNILGVYINAIDYDAALVKILAAAAERQSFTVTALAVHGVMTGVLNPTHRYRLNQLNLVLPDGQPVRWALNLLYKVPLKDRVYGPTLMLKLCEKAAENNFSVYLFGSHDYVLQALSFHLKARFPNLIIAGTQASRFRQVSLEEKNSICEQLCQSGAAIAFIGLGCPRQEIWLYEYTEQIPIPLVAVGAAFDFHAGRLSQAPELLQSLGLEWLYRLFQEPKRLWQRYILLNPLYIILLTLQILRLVKFDKPLTIPPSDEIRYG